MSAELGTLSTLNLHFAQSESKVLGMRGSFIDILRDNAPRVVGALKLGGDISFGLTLSPLMVAYAVCSIAGRMVLLAYGTKANQQKVAAEMAEQGDQTSVAHSSGLVAGIKKILHPKKYPVESSSGLSTIGETFSIAYGATKIAETGAGFTPLMVGLTALLSYAYMLFGKEKLKPEQGAPEQEPANELNFAQSKSKSVGIIGKFKDMVKHNPVLTSSLVQIAIPTGMILGSLAEGLPLTLVVGGGFFLAAAIVQAVFVRKNDFNIEGAKDKNETKSNKTIASFQERVRSDRGQDGFGLQPA